MKKIARFEYKSNVSRSRRVFRDKLSPLITANFNRQLEFISCHQINWNLRSVWRKRWRIESCFSIQSIQSNVAVPNSRLQNRKKNTHATAAHEDYDESLQPARSTSNPYHANEQDDAEDILDAWKIDSKNGSKFLSTQQERAIFDPIRTL